MLKSHFDAIEEYLLALSKIQENTGHSLHKGTPSSLSEKSFWALFTPIIRPKSPCFDPITRVSRTFLPMGLTSPTDC